LNRCGPFLDARKVAKYTTFMAELSFGNNFQSFVAARITLLSDSMALVVSEVAQVLSQFGVQFCLSYELCNHL
jgi:hypothetical protein